MRLTEKQLEAVNADGSVAVVAGAGTGKTAMLTERFLHHVTHDGYSALEIVAVTFTEKAAAELRSRIRAALRENAGELAAAEMDAAQISTIHSLAARICRDHCELAGIPSEFRVLDETDSEILLAESLDEAISGLEPAIVRALGYTWLRDVLRELLRDPTGAEAALSFGEIEWRAAIADACEKAICDLIGSDSWRSAESVLGQFFGDANDTVERRRVSSLAAMEDIAARRNVNEALLVLKGLASNHGAAGRWTGGGLEAVRDCLLNLRDAFKACRETTLWAFGPADAEACRRAAMLRQGFAGVRGYLQREKLGRRVLDFADLERFAVKILKNGSAREHYAKRWKAILVDEFQDTNPDQEQLLNLLSAGGARLTIVGDSKQSVYGFRRADPRVFERFRRRIGSEVILDRTFRTHSELVECENQIFAEMLGDMHQRLSAERTAPPDQRPFLRVFAAEDDSINAGELRIKEANLIAGEIRRMIDTGITVWDKTNDTVRPIQPSDIAILCRTRAPLDIYIDSLLASGISAVNTGGGNLLETRVAMDMIAVMRFAADPSDDIPLVALLRSPFFAISDRELQRLAFQRADRESWWRLIARADGPAADAFRVLSRIVEAVHVWPAEQILKILDEQTAYTAVIGNLSQGDRRMADWLGFLELLRRFARLGRSDVIGVDLYLRELRQAKSLLPRPPVDAGDAVSLMTIHAAKGLEWPVVFITNLSADKRPDTAPILADPDIGVGFKVAVTNEKGKVERQDPAIFKLIKARKKQREAHESARILYVAITRARDHVVLTAAGGRGNDLELLRPGLNRAGISIEALPDVIPRSMIAVNATRDTAESIVQTNAVPIRLRRITMSGLGDYAECPKRFKFRHIDGHPGLPQGGPDGRTIGSLTHRALELGIKSPEALAPVSDGAGEEVCRESARLANIFNDTQEFSEFRIDSAQREVPVRLEMEGLTLVGKADLVGSDWVLDFKTDSEVDPDRHVLQLWAYARGLARPRAVIAYLRHQRTHEYTTSELDSAAATAESVIHRINSRRFEPTPSPTACSRCDFAGICEDRIGSSRI